MQQNLQKYNKKNCENGPKWPIFGPPLGTNGIEKIWNASSIVVLQYSKYIVQKCSLFMVTFGNYSTKTTKKRVKNCENGPK